MTLDATVASFLQQFCPSSQPLLLALSGGADSLCLFYCLLAYREQTGRLFHVAHVDHGWREESKREAQTLQELAFHHHVPFHLKTLDPSFLKGNLEAVCREERYAFFASLQPLHSFQGVLTGHHQNDQAETVFKRLAEGAHWSSWTGLRLESWIDTLRVLRPLLGISKKEIYSFMSQQKALFFEDRSNCDLRFLRARMRETIFPWLNEHFGKQIEGNFAKIGEEAQELADYFDQRLKKISEDFIEGDLGSYWDLQTSLPSYLLEIKYLLRLINKQRGILFSRSVIEQAAQALSLGRANQWFKGGSSWLYIDRKRLFLFSRLPAIQKQQPLKIDQGCFKWGEWEIYIEKGCYSLSVPTSWKEGWKGKMNVCLPLEEYSLAFKETGISLKNIKKKWNQAKVPAFFYDYFPLIWSEGRTVHEFLTGKSLFSLKEGERCWKLKFDRIKNE